jgi:beta-N-acetylhexosaminidase
MIVSTRRAFICGLSGLTLTEAEAAFLARWRPAGIILFSRNVGSPDQVRDLISEARRALGCRGDSLVLVDQEGGRVQRLAEPYWRRFPPAAAFGRYYGRDAARALECAALCAAAMAKDLYALGFNMTCAPVLDLPVSGADRVIGDRAYASDPETAVALAGAVADALLGGGILPVAKHIPGHGRATADSHFALPVVTASRIELAVSDFEPFRALRRLPAAMTAHVVFSAFDAAAPVTVSRTAIADVVRGEIGFDGLLMSDDLSMKALSGSLEQRAAAALDAGCDLALHCNGRMEEMLAVASASPILEGESLARFEKALSCLRAPEPLDSERAEEARLEVLAAAA